MRQDLRAGRLATFAYFTLNGFLMGMWVVHIPSIEHRAGISHAVLGWLLLLLGAGAFAGMQAVGPLTDRFGARTVVPLGAALCSAALVLPGLATSAWTLGAALFVLGVGNGCLDVGMNAHAVQVERGYGRPVMSAFHAAFSIGGVVAALAGALTLGLGWSPALTLGVVALTGLAAAAFAAPALLGRDSVRPAPGAAPSVDDAAPAAKPRTRTPRRIWMLATLALMIMLCEGVANDWSTLHLRQVLDAPASTAALAYGAFATAMTVGRLLADRASARFGPVAILRHGASVAALGLTVAALSPWIPLALAGWALFGAGLSGCVPQLLSAAGHSDQDAAGVHVSRVAGLGYLGMLAGPAVIGPLTQVMPLNLTFFLPVACCVVAACSAGILRQPHPAPAPLKAETAGSV
ncbi:MFS transporter [Streptomyces griseiscabiei]|uniref:MFS transporter n=1 Tax=Streptomyces griseiscabiei TaxID=2993540 RepID=A0ABU4L2I3_9ACTN|nr:MFS transporter [Streptomyces griseiscabiei]MBZ3906037.1 MFS transporter [Streptomyces griseiscabiei]MDX2909670.1 MFS transporter [Streptomyces griseiscabiei]